MAKALGLVLRTAKTNSSGKSVKKSIDLNVTV
jgi:hypothetical protein